MQECDAGTILSAALLGEGLNLSPSPQLGQFYMVPFNDNKNHRKVATFQLGYKGYIKLAIRSGQYKKLNVLPIKQGELISFNPLEEEIKVQLIEDEVERENAVTIGYYAMFEYINGFKKAMYWSREKMESHALKYSEDLGKRNYSGREVHCCLNIYCRPENGELNKTANKYKLNDITVKECRKSRNQYLPPDFKYDIGICSWGYVGKEVEYEGQYNQELYISINKIELKEKVLTIIKNANWSELYPMTTTPRLKQWQVLKYIKEQIPEIN